MSEYIITLEQIKDLVTQTAAEAIDGYKLGVIKQIYQYPLLPKIVRCKDCKRYIPEGTYRFENCVTNKATCDVIRGFIVQIDPDGFCAWGEKKTDESEAK